MHPSFVQAAQHARVGRLTQSANKRQLVECADRNSELACVHGDTLITGLIDRF
jgi:hypothetical protein